MIRRLLPATVLAVAAVTVVTASPAEARACKINHACATIYYGDSTRTTVVGGEVRGLQRSGGHVGRPQRLHRLLREPLLTRRQGRHPRAAPRHRCGQYDPPGAVAAGGREHRHRRRVGGFTSYIKGANGFPSRTWTDLNDDNTDGPIQFRVRYQRGTIA
ncbi:hypothetical protein [Nonomuraea salmonea]|uniref:hypothetical protein n=1 Tax=Nonomuraea salmonea TaxID=46181 RepID=UPI002FEA7359